ncbi:sigma-70 family RNA polymerase sigma factor [Saprospiraceae bacterium]|jgi:RNA polymerase sigma-70 factor (ECF subfamily)|nr:sigma-70 family RNA polymerase sigma factor [Bacteroidota bacterium]MDB4727460.1 sigma-70 family RNA polymerase sigma factor [Saprospiraceae bacterium]MDF1865411.1 sigma-70 family RNA polymerase sigma factor [Saprospiraceae bacterium]
MGKIKRNTKLSDIEAIREYLRTKQPLYFNILYKKYSIKVYSKCLSLLRDEGLAKDATQDIFIKIFLNLAKFGAQSKFSTWVYSITYNYCIDIIRKKKKMRSIFSDEMENPPDIVEDVPDAELLEIEVSRLKVILDKIPVGDKMVLLMKYQDEMQIKEVAKVLGKTDSAIKMKIKRAKHKAKLVYKELYPEEQN